MQTRQEANSIKLGTILDALKTIGNGIATSQARGTSPDDLQKQQSDIATQQQKVQAAQDDAAQKRQAASQAEQADKQDADERKAALAAEQAKADEEQRRKAQDAEFDAEKSRIEGERGSATTEDQKAKAAKDEADLKSRTDAAKTNRDLYDSTGNPAFATPPPASTLPAQNPFADELRTLRKRADDIQGQIDNYQPSGDASADAAAKGALQRMLNAMYEDGGFKDGKRRTRAGTIPDVEAKADAWVQQVVQSLTEGQAQSQAAAGVAQQSADKLVSMMQEHVTAQTQANQSTASRLKALESAQRQHKRSTSSLSNSGSGQ